MNPRIDALEPRRMLVASAPLSVVGTSGDDTIIVTTSGNGEERVINVSRNGRHSSFPATQVNGVLVDAGDGDDRVFIGDGIGATVHGGNGDDDLHGGDGAQVFYGDDGSDKVHAGSGHDRIFGGSGNDFLYGERGDDRIDGDAGKDFLDGGAGNDVLRGMAARDTVFGGLGSDLLSGGGATDVLNGGRDNDSIFAQDGSRDFVFGGKGKDLAQVDAHLDDLESIESTGVIPVPPTPSPTPQQVTFDPNFGDNGVATFPNTYMAAQLAVRSDGKIFVGFSPTGGELQDERFTMGRLNADGSIDKTFGGGDGIVRLELRANPSGTRYEISDLTVQDGKPLALARVIAFSGGLQSYYALVRLTADGAVDNSFGDHGQVYIQANPLPFQQSLRVLSNGDIEIAAATTGELTMARFDSNGHPDTSLGTDGVKSIDFGKLNVAAGSIAVSGFPYESDVAIDSDGSIAVAAAFPEPGGKHSARVMLFSPDGSLNNSFAGDGVSDAFASTERVFSCVTFQPDHKIVVGGDGHPNDPGDYLIFPSVARFNTDGSPDDSFGNQGISETNQALGPLQVLRVAVAPNGDIALMTYFSAVYRFNSHGVLEAPYRPAGVPLEDNANDRFVGVLNDLAMDKRSGVLIAGFSIHGAVVGRLAANPEGVPGFAHLLNIVGGPGPDYLRLTAAAVHGKNVLLVNLNGVVSTYSDVDGELSRLQIFMRGGDDRIIIQMRPETTFGPDLIDAGDGNDRITVLSSSRSLNIDAGAGDDRIEVGDVGDGEVGVRGDAGNDFIQDGKGGEVLDGEDGNDTIIGGAGKDTVDGGGGDDSIVANDGERDSLFGGTGNDSARIDIGLDELDGIEAVI